MNVTWITQRWTSGDEARDAELAKCRDLNRSLFGTGYVAIGYHDERTTWGDLMQRSGPGINIIANSDIYTSSHAVSAITGFYSKPANANVCMALSRWDVGPDGVTAKLYDHRDSQDAWVYLGKPPKALIEAALHVPMGIPGCDNRLCRLFADHGYTVINPSRTVRMFHLHNSGYRTYGKGRGGAKAELVLPPYLFVKTTALT